MKQKDYCASVHRAPSKGRISADEVFGGRSQQDATDYFRFIIDILDDELNSRRNLPLWNSSITDADKTALNKMDHFTGAWKASALLNRNEASLITREMRTEMCLIDQCNRCHTIQKQHVMREYWEIYLGREKAVRERDGALPPRGKLFDAIARTTGRPLPDALDGFDCEVCIAARREKKDRYATRTEMASKLPNYLIIAIHRGNSDEQFAEPQILDFPEHGFDMSPFVLPVPKPEPGGVPPERKGPFLYDIFAVVQHRGTMINNGHYVTFAKSLDQPKTFRGKPAAGQWHRFDDSRVTPADFNDTQNGGSVIFFFRRQGIKNN
jgi:ubiquitin carboxyl-terminal hydrolase 8